MNLKKSRIFTTCFFLLIFSASQSFGGSLLLRGDFNPDFTGTALIGSEELGGVSIMGEIYTSDKKIKIGEVTVFPISLGNFKFGAEAYSDLDSEHKLGPAVKWAGKFWGFSAFSVASYEFSATGGENKLDFVAQAMYPVFENVSAGVQVFGLKMGDVEFLDVRPKVVFNLGDGFPLFFINGNHRLQHGEIKNGFMTGVAFSF